jgi:hypothetical protein
MQVFNNIQRATARYNKKEIYTISYSKLISTKSVPISTDTELSPAHLSVELSGKVMVLSGE